MDKDEPYPYYCPAGGVLPGRFRELPESSAGQDNCQPVKSQVEGFHQVPAVSYQNENGGAARETGPLPRISIFVLIPPTDREVPKQAVLWERAGSVVELKRVHHAVEKPGKAKG